MLRDFTIKEFKGIDQSKSENRLDAGSSPDACNMDTAQGDLMVARGFVDHGLPPVPGAGDIRRLYVWRDLVTIRYVVAAGMEIYAYVTTHAIPAWNLIYTYPADVPGESPPYPPFTGLRWDFLEARIGEEDYLIIANGERQMIKWDGKTEQAELFGSGAFVLETTVSSYTAATKTVVLAASIDDLAKKRLEQVGIEIGATDTISYPVKSVDQQAKSVVLDDTNPLPGTPATGNVAKVRGGVSDAKANYIDIYFGRLFAAGDLDFPSRLHYSQPAGDKRSIEDWSMEEASENASGGFIEVGNTSKDPITGLCALSNQLLIFKRASIYRLLGDRPGNYRVTQVFADVEQMANSALSIYGDTPFWLTRAGVYYHDGQISRPMHDARKIKDILKNARVSMTKAKENRDRLYFTIREGDNDSYLDNAMIVYDVPERTYMIRRGFDVADIASVNGVLYMINDKRIIYRFDEGDTYDGEPIHAYWHTPLTDLDNKAGIKELKEIYFRAEGGIILIDSTVGGNTQYLRYMIPETLHEVEEIPLKNEGRAFSFKLYNEQGSQFKITGGFQVLYNPRQRPL